VTIWSFQIDYSGNDGPQVELQDVSVRVVLAEAAGDVLIGKPILWRLGLRLLRWSLAEAPRTVLVHLPVSPADVARITGDAVDHWTEDVEP
jgi:hypothetical protein